MTHLVMLYCPVVKIVVPNCPHFAMAASTCTDVSATVTEDR